MTQLLREVNMKLNISKITLLFNTFKFKTNYIQSNYAKFLFHHSLK
jgi:hypothetical protein